LFKHSSAPVVCPGTPRGSGHELRRPARSRGGRPCGKPHLRHSKCSSRTRTTRRGRIPPPVEGRVRPASRTHPMQNRDKLALGLLAGVGLAWGARAWLRSRRHIELDDRVVIITGGTTGHGLLVAKAGGRAGRPGGPGGARPGGVAGRRGRAPAPGRPGRPGGPDRRHRRGAGPGAGLPDGGPLRPDRRAGQQRGHDQRRPPGDDDPRRLPPGDGDQLLGAR
jgi:hypothetical protein